MAAAECSLKSGGQQGGWAHWISWTKPQNLVVFIGYLEAQEADPVHILQFRSTHQYYRTAKYELHRTTGDGDTRCYLFHYSNFLTPQIQLDPRRGLAMTVTADEITCSSLPDLSQPIH